MLERNPLVWLLEVDGLLVDARDLPEAFQAELHMGYAPGNGSASSR